MYMNLEMIFATKHYGLKQERALGAYFKLRLKRVPA